MQMIDFHLIEKTLRTIQSNLPAPSEYSGIHYVAKTLVYVDLFR
jgi:hypothetical protein